MDFFLQQLVNGLSLGSLYALIAVGYTVVYGIVQLINFPHGEIFMVGAFGAFTVWMLLGQPTGVGEERLPRESATGNLVAIDPRAGWISIAERVTTGQPVVFTRRDPETAAADMRRMLDSLKKRVKATPKGAVYVSCIARGPSLFGTADAELAMIRETFGDIPLTGFFASGEVSHNRLYGYTGVLTLFL